MKSAEQRLWTRRKCLGAGAMALAALAFPVDGIARVVGVAQNGRERSLSLCNLHTGERLSDAVYWAEGRYNVEVLQEINRLLRDHRTGQVQKIDRRLLNGLYSLKTSLPGIKEFHIISGYRSPVTNDHLRAKSKKVARNSFHTLGRAIDIRVPGCQLTTLHRAALKMRRGGVGYYPNSKFVHLDTGPVRAW